MGYKKVVYIAVIAIFVVLLACSFVSAGLFDRLTGRAASHTTNLTVGITGVNQVVVESVSEISAQNPTELGKTTITFSAVLYDADGVNDLNDSSVGANFSKAGETTRMTSDTGLPDTCSYVEDLDAFRANYSCTIDMWYWDGSGVWTVNVRGNDIGNLTENWNTSTTFTYNELKAMVISPAALSFGSLTSGATNQNATDDPITVNNTGNYNSTIDVTALDLLGETDSTDKIRADNFTISFIDAQECTNGTTMLNASAITVAYSLSNKGNLTAGGGSGQETLYFCMPTVPLVPTQTYSTTAGGAWTIAY